MSLPFLPGFTFNTRSGKERFHKSHYLEKKNGICHIYNDNRPGIGGDPLPGQRFDPPMSEYPVEDVPSVPSWIAFDKKVLCFDAFIKSSSSDPYGCYGVRKCQVLFYLEDDTIQVVEQKIINSGLPQGTIVRRSRIPKPQPNEKCFYTVDDFNVGVDLIIYGRVYHLISCDEFTADFLRRMGVQLNESEEMPVDQLNRLCIKDMTRDNTCQPQEHPFKLKQFLDHDRQVLRFYCFWDDTETPFGDARDFVLCYFLADDTIEITEKILPNSGRDTSTCFLRRQKLPKGVPELPLPGADELVVCNKSNCKPVEYYTDKDLTLGTFLNVYGRKFLICDCDDFTKDYYRKRYSIENFEPAHPPRAKYAKVKKQANDRCSDEDSLTNCCSLLLSSQKCERRRKNIEAEDSHVLHFMARIANEEECGDARKFIISHYLSDSTFVVYEPQVRNSGGKFMERRQVMKPEQLQARKELPECYSSADIFIGAQLILNGFTFDILSADEFTLNFMENRASEFPVADMSRIMKKLKPLVSGREDDVRTMAIKESQTHLRYKEFENFVRKLLRAFSEQQICLVLHEIVTLARHYSNRQACVIYLFAISRLKRVVDCADAMSLIQQHLRRHSYDSFENLLAACLNEDYRNTSLLDSVRLRRIFKANHFPISDETICKLLNLFKKEGSEMVDYKRFIDQMNWKTNSMPSERMVCAYTGDLEGDLAKLFGENFALRIEDLEVHHVAFIDDLIKLKA